MAKFQYFNANPENNRVGDCTVRALSKALNQDWETTYIGLMVQGLMMHDMPSANHVWGAYLKSKGYQRHIIPSTCPDCYTVKDFCNDNPEGNFILAISGHVVAVESGSYFDTWDSGGELPVYYWKRKDD